MALSISELTEKLARGWTEQHHGASQEWLQRWREKLQASAEEKGVQDGGLHFVTGFDSIRLRGMDEIQCLMLSGAGQSVADVLREFWRKAWALGRLPFVIAFSEEARGYVASTLPAGRFLLIGADQACQLLESANPREVLKRLLREQISPIALNPFDFLHPAAGNMFFGRGAELALLIEASGDSFAIAGPGMAGKTSLSYEYERVLTRSRDPRRACLRKVSFYHCADKSDDGVARHLAKQLDSSKWSDRITADELVGFIKYQRNRCGGPLELLLDEVDEVCRGRAFKALGEAARNEYCRIVLCGRGVLLKLGLDSFCPIGYRLKLIRLAATDQQTVARLLLEPLRDLGLVVAEPERLVDHVMGMTSGLPHLVQFYGQRLAERVATGGQTTVSLQDADYVREEFVTAGYFVGPLKQVTVSDSRYIALLMLRDAAKSLSVPDVQRLAASDGVSLDVSHLGEICDDLVINNILAWRNGVYRVACEGMRYYATRHGWLESALREARLAVRKQLGGSRAA